MSPPVARFSHTKFLVLLIFALNTEFEWKWNSIGRYKTQFEKDLQICPACFRGHYTGCMEFLQLLEYDENAKFYNYFNSLLHLVGGGKRRVYMLEFKNNGTRKVVAKYYAKAQQLKWLEESTGLTISDLRQRYLESHDLESFQFYPLDALSDFVNLFNNSQLQTWLYANINIQPVLMPYLHAAGFPVPRTYATCGFAHFQAYAGESLLQYYSAEFSLKLSLAHKLLDLALKFSHGFDGYRLYITDLTELNLMYNEDDGQLYLVDLDTVIIVNTNLPDLKYAPQHKFLPWPCDECFAYSPEDLSKTSLSDINMYSACKLLREDLAKDLTKGFLYPIPQGIRDEYPQLEYLMNQCIECADGECASRFETASKLGDLIELILLATN